MAYNAFFEVICEVIIYYHRYINKKRVTPTE